MHTLKGIGTISWRESEFLRTTIDDFILDRPKNSEEFVQDDRYKEQAVQALLAEFSSRVFVDRHEQNLYLTIKIFPSIQCEDWEEDKMVAISHEESVTYFNKPEGNERSEEPDHSCFPKLLVSNIKWLIGKFRHFTWVLLSTEEKGIIHMWMTLDKQPPLIDQTKFLAVLCAEMNFGLGLASAKE